MQFVKGRTTEIEGTVLSGSILPCGCLEALVDYGSLGKVVETTPTKTIRLKDRVCAVHPVK